MYIEKMFNTCFEKKIILLILLPLNAFVFLCSWIRNRKTRQLQQKITESSEEIHTNKD